MKKTFLYVALFALMLNSSCDFKIPALAGSYVYSENYQFDISNKELIEKIINFKAIYPNYQSCNSDYYEFRYDEEPVRTYNEDGSYSYQGLGGHSDTLTKNSIWFHCSFYFSDIKATVYCVINVRQNAIVQPALFRLVSYCPDMKSCKEINRKGEISREDNRLIKKKFEEEILDKLGVKWRHARWYE
jgi:hypothetical protein